MTTLFLFYLLFKATNGDITGICGGDVILRCPVNTEMDPVEYRAVSWYRVSGGRLSGIIRWDRQTNTVRRFAKLTQLVESPSGDGLTLEVRNLTAGDGGVYRCALWAPVGQRNKEGDTQLYVTGCSNEVDSFDVPLCVAVAVALFGCMLLCVYYLQKQFFARRKGFNPTAEAYVQIGPFLKKPDGFITQLN